MDENQMMSRQSCMDACMRCAAECYRCFSMCLEEPDVKERIRCVKSLIGCARLCELSAAAMQMDGPMATELCGICATMCERCSEECDRFEDSHCKSCAEECRKCADECRAMIISENED